MTNLKLTRPEKNFGSILLYLPDSLIYRTTIFLLIFAWIVASPLNENLHYLDVYNVQTQLGCNLMFSTIKMVTNDPNLSPNPSPVTSAATTPAGAVMDPPLVLDDPLLNDPLLPGINFLQNVPFLNQLPNFLPVPILTPPILGGLGNLVGIGALVPLAAQLAHNVNPTIIPGAGFQAPAVLPNAFWPVQAPLIPNPLGDPNVAAGIAGAASTQLPVILLGGGALIFLAAAFYKKKVTLPKTSDDASPLNEALSTGIGTGKPLKYSLPADDPWKNFNQRYSLPSDKVEGLGFLQVELVPHFSVKVFGFPINFNMIPFICVTGSLNETFITLFLALLRRGFICLMRQQIAAFWKVLISCKIKNAHLLFFGTTLIKNLSKFRIHSQDIIIKTKIVIMYIVRQILLLLKKW